MTVLPTKEDLGQRPNLNPATPQPSSISVDLTQAAKGQAALAKGLTDLAAGAEKYQLAKDHSAFIQAKSHFLQKSIAAQSALEKDPDFETYGKRYDDAMAEAKKESLEILGKSNVFGTSALGNRFSDNLNAEIDLHQAQGLDRLSDVAAKKQGDFERANLDDLLNNNSSALLQTADEKQRASLLMTTSEAIDSKAQQGFISQEEAVKLKQNFAEDVAINRISLLPPQQQLQTLNPKKGKNGETYFQQQGNWSDAISPDKKVILLNKAQTALKQEQNASIEAIRNADFLKRRNAENNSTNIILKGGTVADIPLDQYALLSESQRANLNKIQEIKNGTYQLDPIKGDEAYYKYSTQYQEDPEAFAQVDQTAIRAEVSPNKVDQVLGWHQKASAKINAPADVKQFNDISSQTLRSIGVNGTTKSGKTQSTLFKNRLNQEVEYFKEVHGKDPTVKELTSMAQDLVVKATFDGGWLGSTKEKRVYEVAKDKINEQIVVPEDFTNKILSQAQKANLPPLTKEQIKSAYMRKLNER